MGELEDSDEEEKELPDRMSEEEQEYLESKLLLDMLLYYIII